MSIHAKGALQVCFCGDCDSLRDMAKKTCVPLFLGRPFSRPWIQFVHFIMKRMISAFDDDLKIYKG